MELTADQQIDNERAKREKEYAPWFADQLNDVPAEDIRALAETHGFDVPERDEDETDEEYAERVADDAHEYVTKLRDEENRLDEEFLGVNVAVTITMRVEISTGGPGDYLTADIDPTDREMSNVRYHFAPWFDHASVSVESGSALYAVAARFASYYDNGQTIDEIVASS